MLIYEHDAAIFTEGINMNDYVVIIRSPDHPNIQIEFKIPHSKSADVVTYLAQFKHEIVRPVKSEEFAEGVAPEGYL